MIISLEYNGFFVLESLWFGWFWYIHSFSTKTLYILVIFFCFQFFEPLQCYLVLCYKTLHRRYFYLMLWHDIAMGHVESNMCTYVVFPSLHTIWISPQLKRNKYLDQPNCSISLHILSNQTLWKWGQQINYLDDNNAYKDNHLFDYSTIICPTNSFSPLFNSVDKFSQTCTE